MSLGGSSVRTSFRRRAAHDPARGPRPLAPPNTCFSLTTIEFDGARNALSGGLPSRHFGCNPVCHRSHPPQVFFRGCKLTHHLATPEIVPEPTSTG